MKKFLKVLLFCVLLTALTVTEAFAVQGADLTDLTGDELQAVIEDAKLAEAAYHVTPSATQSVLRDLTEGKVEAFYASSGIEVSWPWFGYVYTRDWDFYTISTHVKYKAGGRQEDPVYAEVFGYSTQPDVYYLEAGGTVLVDRRSEIPSSHRLADPGAMINDETGIDFALLSGAELADMKSDAKQELKSNHTPQSSVTKQVKNMTKDIADEYFASVGEKSSWPRIGYDFTREWDLYTMMATVKAGGKKLDVLSEAFPVDNQFSIVYLEIDGEVVKDRRDLILLPEKKSASVAEGASAAPAGTAPDVFAAPPATQPEDAVPVFMAPPTPGIDTPAATAVPLWTPEPTPEPTPAPTEKPVPESVHLEQDMEGDLVKKVQRRLKDIGYLAGEVDGYYGEITYWTVWIWQGDNGLPVTGEINDAEMRLLFPEEYE